jgi:hypothetical protein
MIEAMRDPEPAPIKEPLEPDEEQRQQQHLMMKKYYRNRHATFMKALLQKKKNEQEAIEEQRAKEERIKKKVRDKVLASLNEPAQTTDNYIERDPLGSTSKRINHSVIGRTHRSSSMSV